MEKQEQGKLGLGACIAILTGGCIGSAIFSISGMTMYYAGPASVLSWILGAIILACMVFRWQNYPSGIRIPAACSCFRPRPWVKPRKKVRFGDLFPHEDTSFPISLPLPSPPFMWPPIWA